MAPAHQVYIGCDVCGQTAVLQKFMDINSFSESQRRALLDLLVLGMYSDGKLGAKEDAWVQSILDTFQFESDYARNQYLDASFARVRQEAQTEDSARAYAVNLARSFTSPEHRRTVCDALERMMAGDNEVSAKESRLLSVVKEICGTDAP